jgi:protein TonB
VYPDFAAQSEASSQVPGFPSTEHALPTPPPPPPPPEPDENAMEEELAPPVPPAPPPPDDAAETEDELPPGPAEDDTLAAALLEAAGADSCALPVAQPAKRRPKTEAHPTKATRLMKRQHKRS